MNILKIAEREFVARFAVKPVSFIDRKVPICVLRKALSADEIIFSGPRWMVFRPFPFFVSNEMVFGDEFRCEIKGLSIQFYP